jgi:hypothetical protein
VLVFLQGGIVLLLGRFFVESQSDPDGEYKVEGLKRNG